MGKSKVEQMKCRGSEVREPTVSSGFLDEIPTPSLNWRLLFEEIIDSPLSRCMSSSAISVLFGKGKSPGKYHRGWSHVSRGKPLSASHA